MVASNNKTVGIVTRQEVPGFDPQQKQDTLSSLKKSKQQLRTTCPPIQRVSQSSYLQIRRPDLEANISPCGTEIKKAWSYASVPPYGVLVCTNTIPKLKF
jgi:hypothetical protein